MSSPIQPINAPINAPFRSRAMLLGALAGFLEALLVLETGSAPASEVAGNMVLLVVAFGGAAVAWNVVRHLPLLRLLSEETVLVLVSVLTFALRGCLHNCDGVGLRLGIPLSIGVAAVSLLAFGRRFRPLRQRRDFILVAAAAMTAAASDFAIRNGIEGSSQALAEAALQMAAVSVVSSFLADRGRLLKIAWTLCLLAFVSVWAGYNVRPLSIEPAAKRSGSSVGGGKAQFPNVILVVLDTVRADHLSLYGYPRKTSPNLDALAAESLVFDHAIASGNYSLPSHASLFSGLLPGGHGARPGVTDEVMAQNASLVDFGLAPDVQTLASRVGALGFTTGGASANYVYVARWTGLHRGFDQFDDRPKRYLGYHPFAFPFQRRLFPARYRPSERAEWEGSVVTEAGRSFALAAREPFFLFLNYFDAHAPYQSRAEHPFRGDGVGSDVRPIPAYDSEIAYTDAMLGGLLEALRRDSVLDRTILVVTADHGEFFGEHRLGSHGQGAYEEVLRVPLLVRYPKTLPAGRIQRPFGLHEANRLTMDVVESRPTDWLYPYPDQPRVLSQIWGKLTSKDAAQPVTEVEPEANVVYLGSYKLIARRTGPDEMYDLAVDPTETHNLLLEPSAVIISLQARMRVAAARLPPARKGVDPEATALDLAALRGLGYISPKRPGGN